ncbi:MAG: restriction endonuclease [Burkholderiales bacterium]|jgi:hypothetical protein|nr:restriction endonuclease [Burkholderiales bacterium]
MKIVAHFDFNGGEKKVSRKYKNELAEITSAINAIDAKRCKTKISKEKTMPGRALFSPSKLNKEFKRLLYPMGWVSHNVPCDYVYGKTLDGYVPMKRSSARPFREMDFIKNGKKLGVEVQFGKYSFMVYNVCAKMTIFKNLGLIDAGIEIVPVKHFADEMSTGVSYFEQFAWDLTMRGVSDIDIPVLILGIDA